MSDFKELKEKYQGKIWKRRGTNERILVKELIYYEGIRKYKIAFQTGMNPTEYMHDISDEKLFDFLMDLENPYKVLKPKPIEEISMETKNNDMETPTENKINNLDDLSKKVFDIINDVINDKIKIEKAVAVSKLAQVILNIEKHKALFSEKK